MQVDVSINKSGFYVKLIRELKEAESARNYPWFLYGNSRRKKNDPITMSLRCVDSSSEVYNKLAVKLEIYGIKVNAKEEKREVTTGWLWWKKTKQTTIYTAEGETKLVLNLSDKGLDREIRGNLASNLRGRWYSEKMTLNEEVEIEAVSENEEELEDQIRDKLAKDILSKVSELGLKAQNAFR
jgi:hypothetical protein